MTSLARYTCALLILAAGCDDGGGDSDAEFIGDGGPADGMDLPDGMDPPDGDVADMAPDMPMDCPDDQLFVTLREDTLYRKACSPYRIGAALVISDGATLTIEPGVEVQFGGDAQVIVGQPGSPGGLVADGTAAEPIRFTFLPDGPSDAPRWEGLRFDTDALPTTLRNVQLEDCGQNDRACVQIRKMSGQLTFDTVTIRNADVGVQVDDSAIGTMTGLVFEAVPIPLDIHANRVGEITEVFDFPEGSVNRIFSTGGRNAVTTSATWIDLGRPWRTPREWYVEAAPGWMEGDPIPVLTLEAGVVLELPATGKLQIGDDRPGGLVTHGTDIAPVHIRPAPGGEGSGQIRGLMVSALSRGSMIAGLHITSGGLGDSVDSAFGCLTVMLRADANTELSVTGSTFEDCDQAGIGTDRASDGFAFGALSGNTFRNSPYGVKMLPNHFRTFTGDQTYDGVLNNAIIGGVAGRAAGVLTTPATWASQPVSFNVIDDLEIEADLVIEGPNRFNFEPDKMMRVAEENPAHLIAMGADGQPVEFAAASDERGGWKGIVFYPNTLPTTNLTFVVVRDGGDPSGNLVQGCVTLRREAGPISLVNVQLLRCAQAGIGAIGEGDHFQALSGITFSDIPAGFHLHPDSLSEVIVGMGYQGVDKNLVDPGRVATDGTWIAQDVPWVLNLNGNGPTIEIDALLTIDEGFELQFPESRPTGGVTVGGRGGGQLVVNGSEANPVVFRNVPGDPGWNQVRFEAGTLEGTVINWLRIIEAGAANNRAAMFLRDTESRVTIQSPRFVNIGAAAIECNDSTPTLGDIQPGDMVVGCVP